MGFSFDSLLAEMEMSDTCSFDSIVLFCVGLAYLKGAGVWDFRWDSEAKFGFKKFSALDVFR